MVELRKQTASETVHYNVYRSFDGSNYNYVHVTIDAVAEAHRRQAIIQPD